jgi:hypothetical protein
MLTVITEGVWGFEHDLRLPGGLRLPSRSTIVRLPSGGLLVHSPLPFAAEAAEAIEALGPVEAIVAPSCVHWLFVAAAAERWPKARVYGAPGLEQKMKGTPFERLPHDGAVDGLGDDLVVRRIDGVPRMTEHVFLHRPSRSIIVTDLLFNVRRCSLATQLLLRLTGTYGKTAQSRIWRLLTRDKAAAAESARSVLAWDFDRVVVAHGDVIDIDARERTRAALARMMAGAPAPRALLA